jgi:AraC-like DNA-binding protein
MKNEIVRVLSVAGCVEALFLSIVFFVKKGKPFIERQMSLIMLALAFAMLSRYFFAGGALVAAACLSFAAIPALSLLGPLVLGLVSRVAAGADAKPRNSFFLFASCLVPTLAYFAVFMFLGTEKAPPGRIVIDPFRTIFAFACFSCLIAVFNGMCFFLSFRLLLRFRASLKDHFSELSKLGFAWLKGILIFMGLIALLDVGMPLAWMLERRSMTMGGMIGFAPGIAYLAFIFFVALFAFIHPDVLPYLEQFYSSLRGDGPAIGTKTDGSMKYRKQSFPAEQRKEYLGRILDFMAKEKPYLHEKLTIVEFSEMIDIPVHLISMTINAELSQNFYTFINSFRIEAARTMLRSQEHADSSILEIGYEAGFNSKSTFNALFKKYTGTTPNAYRKKV